MLNVLKKNLVYIQIPLLYLSYYLCRLFVKKETNKWVIGVDDMASTIYFIGNVLDPSVTVSLSKNKFYTLKYDYFLSIQNKYIHFIIRIFYGPILLGYLANTSTHFFYIWSTGFLFNRDKEFAFLKSTNKKIVCLFVGDDIRSLKLTIDYAKNNKIDTYANYYVNTTNQKYENDKIGLAKSADQYADLIFNAKIDQISYLKSKQYGWTYTYDKKKFFRDDTKFDKLQNIKILHSPSNPIAKGTQLVRAAIKKLELEGYKFEYIELINVLNDVVLEHLKSTHIVLNQFYAFAPGLFGIESMANHCAVLMSADPTIETTLPQDSQDAWMITKYWEIYDNLKYLLDNPSKIKYYADRGYNFTEKHYTYGNASKYINKTLKENGIID